MPEHRDRALVLRTRPYREHDLLVTVFGEHLGKVGAVARGAHRPTSALAAGTQLLAVSDVRLHQGRSSLWTLAGADLVQSYPRVRADLERTARAAMLADALDELWSEHDPAPASFRILVAALEALDRGGHPATVFLAGLWRLLGEAGLKPSWDTCQECGGRAVGETAWRDGSGPVCARCRTPADHGLKFGTLTLLRYWERLPPERWGDGRGSRDHMTQLERLTRDHLLYHTGRIPRAFRFWQQVQGTLEEDRQS
jgi:DNA repair protein RecO (recombination protein O)